MMFENQPDVRLPEMWSPSTLNVLKSCGLRLAYSLDPKIKNEFRRGNTYSAMGTSAHKITEMAWKNEFKNVEESELAQVLTSKWNDLIQDQHAHLTEEWFPAAVPVPRDWPYFSITQVRTISRVQQEIKSRIAAGKDNVRGTTRVEKKLSDPDNCIEGIPDRVILTGHGFFILDLKTGHSITSISDGHRRQLLIYAHLVSLTTKEPLLGIGVVTAGGETIWEDVEEDEVDQVMREAKDDISTFTKSVSEGSLSNLANPSPENCRFCEYRPLCQSYWTDTNEDWLEYRGVVGRVKHVVDERTLTIEKILPSGSDSQVIGVSNSHHSASEGEIVAVTDGYLRGQSLRGSWYTRVNVIKEKS